MRSLGIAWGAIAQFSAFHLLQRLIPLTPLQSRLENCLLTSFFILASQIWITIKHSPLSFSLTSTGVCLAFTPISTSTLLSISLSSLPGYPTQTHQQNQRKNITLSFSATSSQIFFSFLGISTTLSLSLFLSFAPKNLSSSLQLSQPLVEEPKREREKNGIILWSSTWRSKGRREDLQNQVRLVPLHWQRHGSQARHSLFSDFFLIDFYIYLIWLRCFWIWVIIQSFWL